MGLFQVGQGSRRNRVWDFKVALGQNPQVPSSLQAFMGVSQFLHFTTPRPSAPPAQPRSTDQIATLPTPCLPGLSDFLEIHWLHSPGVGPIFIPHRAQTLVSVRVLLHRKTSAGIWNLSCVHRGMLQPSG
jgi:hypothetical protein